MTLRSSVSGGAFRDRQRSAVVVARGLVLLAFAAGMVGGARSAVGQDDGHNHGPIEPIALEPTVPPLDLPQARIQRIDVSEFPKVRVFGTVLDRNGRPVALKAVKKLSVVDAKLKSRPPYIAFQAGQPLDGRKDGNLIPMDKAGVPTALVIVASGYQAPALRNGSLGRRLKEALASAFKPLAKTDRVNLIWANDRLYRFVGLKGRTGELADVEETRKVCADARFEALTGGPITGAGPATEEAPSPAAGTDLCGLATDPKPIITLLKGQQTAFEGYFPRPFNLGAPFYDYRRYCKPPREALQKYGEFTPENAKVQTDARAARQLKGEALDYETSAMDEALKLLLRDSRQGEQKVLILVGDGKDGYFRDLELCQENPPESCRALADDAVKQQDCIRQFLNQRLIAQQVDFRSRAAFWIGTARAAGIRIFAVGLGMLGEPYELERLRLLAERTGGTYREVEKEENLATELNATMSEVLGQWTIEFVHQTPDEVEGTLNLRLAVELDPSMVRGDVTKLGSVGVTAVIEPRLGWTARVEKSLRGAAATAQGVLGYTLYVVVGVAILVLVSLVFLLILFLIVRRIFRKAKG